jgi:hypothetical protein
VYGFGSNNDFGWENSIRKVRKDADIFIFDPTLDQTKGQAVKVGQAGAQKYAKKAGYHFVPIGLAYRRGTLEMVMPKGHIVSFRYNSQYSSLRGGGHFDKLFYQDKKKEKTLFSVPTKTLDVLMQENGHEYIDILKIDISGEFELMYSLVS